VPKPWSSLAKRLASSVRAERQHRGWTQEEAAAACELNMRHYQKLEAGSVNATLETLGRLCRAFEVDVSRLFKS
jgi:transcriptional regulator with XRE-family HTH domain